MKGLSKASRDCRPPHLPSPSNPPRKKLRVRKVSEEYIDEMEGVELQSIFHECLPGRRKLAVKVVDIFGNDTMKIVEVTI